MRYRSERTARRTAMEHGGRPVYRIDGVKGLYVDHTAGNRGLDHGHPGVLAFWTDRGRNSIFRKLSEKVAHKIEQDFLRRPPIFAFETKLKDFYKIEGRDGLYIECLDQSKAIRALSSKSKRLCWFRPATEHEIQINLEALAGPWLDC